MSKFRTQINGLDVNTQFLQFINNEVLPGTGIAKTKFWRGFSKIINDLSPVNETLLEKRAFLQNQIDDWYNANPTKTLDVKAQKSFLKKIGYLVPEGKAFSVNTSKVDRELTSIAGPQLVVPIMNARYALNAANARWGSLYDALYGTDAIAQTGEANITKTFNPIRGKKVIAWGKKFLDKIAPLNDGKHAQVSSYCVEKATLIAKFKNGQTTLAEKSKFAGFTGPAQSPTSILFRNNNLMVEIVIDNENPVGATDKASVADILVESAISVIMDCEDSVAAVDAEDKILVYRNWLGLMKGTLQDQFEKNGKTIIRQLNPDKQYKKPNGRPTSHSARALMFVRNVGHLMTNPTILTKDGAEIPEGILDAVVTSLCALHDIGPKGRKMNSQKGSMYIVKPKMHGPEEVKFADTLFGRVEALLDMPRNTLKMGIMDEERRTSVNLKECIRAAKSRVVFINTGFLDRTGDEIHTAMEAGPMIRKADMKASTWLTSYEDNNVDVGLACGLSGHGQIGKGMWAAPDLMAEMLKVKIGHPRSGANTAWVPSPTAATLHATHYHEVSISDVQKQLSKRKKVKLDDILSIPIAKRPNWDRKIIRQELDNNAQGILGYVVRWIDQGVGCSKVPDIYNVGLMEDRATLRISSQHIANWLRHEVCTKTEVMASLKRMAKVVDKQNKDDPFYQKMSADFDNSIAFKAACDLVFLGCKQPSGYTEPLLHKWRREFKKHQA